MLSFLRGILPYGISSGNFRFNFKKFIKNILPTFIVNKIIKANKAKIFTTEYLKNNFVSDLSENEKWSILSVLLFLENKFKQVSYLEVGIYAGGTIKFLKQNLNCTHFTGIDLFEDFVPTESNTHFWKNYSLNQVFEALGRDKTNLFKGDSISILNNLYNERKRFDFIFIDGNHTYDATRNDYMASLKLLKEGGYIAFHNCSPGMTQEDKYYLKLDGGPWMLSHELILENKMQLVSAIERIRIFRILDIYSGPDIK